jgi:hypothetical protein
MRHVIYAYDWEPITVVELSEFAADELAQRCRVVLPVPTALPEYFLETAPLYSFGRAVRLEATMFMADGRPQMVLRTEDEESALLLKAAFLPGQRAALKEHERTAFARGFITALNKYGA